jgi:hypothetical protein
MHRRVDVLKEEHGRLRVLLSECEHASASQLPPLLVRLGEALRPHLQAKEALYVAALPAVKSAGTPTELSLLGIFRTNLGVVASAVMGFLASPDPQPERLKQRLGSVTGALRTLLDTEEKVVFPLVVRHGGSTGTGARPTLNQLAGSAR